jgi:hypothetical protein
MERPNDHHQVGSPAAREIESARRAYAAALETGFDELIATARRYLEAVVASVRGTQ